MGESPEDIVRAVYRCFNSELRGLELLIPDTAVLVQDPAFPDAREWHGPEGVKEWFAQIAGQLGSVRVEPTDLVTSGDADAVLATVAISARGRTSGAPVSHVMAQLWTFSDGAVDRCHFYLDAGQARVHFDRLAGARAE